MDATEAPEGLGTPDIRPEAITSPVAAALIRRGAQAHVRRTGGPRAGIGRALLMRLEGEARALGLTRLVLETGTRQTEALALYRSAGFTEIAPYGEYAASAATSVCFAKNL